jgi:tetratricopeptide (TPR) repeat protein
MEKYEIREQFAQQLMREASSQGQNVELLKSVMQRAEDEMEQSLRENPLDFRPHLFLARLYTTDYRISRDKVKLDAAEKVLEKAIELSPTNQQGYWYMTEVKLARNQEQKAYELFQKTIDLEPDLGLSYWYFGITYKLKGRYQEAAEKIRQAEERGFDYRKNAYNLREAIGVYEALGDYEALVYLYESAVELQPKDANSWFNLADNYRRTGQTEKAREAALKAKDLDPNLAGKVNKLLEKL